MPAVAVEIEVSTFQRKKMAAGWIEQPT